MAKSWTFEGWDGSEWIVLDTRSNLTDWARTVGKEFVFENTTAYKKYRINVSENCGHYILSIGEIEMMESIYE